MTAMAKVPKGCRPMKFSKNFKKKNKFSKKGKKEFKSTGKRGRLIVRNLPFKCNEKDLHKHFEQFGEIKDVHLLRRPDNKLVGCGFVEFTSRLHADRAAEQLNGKAFLGRPIYIERAVARERFDEPSKETNFSNKKEKSGNVLTNELDDSTVKEEPVSDEESSANETKVKEESESEDDSSSDEEIHIKPQEIKQEEVSSDDEDEAERTNDEKHSKNLKKARLIVRNLSFKSTEEKLKSHFTQFGEVLEVKLLRRPDNSLVGCGFVQFSKKLAAAKAIHHTSGKPFLGRPIIVDWAVPKDKFKKMQEEAVKKEIKKEDKSDEEPSEMNNVTVKKEESSSEESEETSDEESESEEGEEDEDEEESDDDNDNDIKPTIKQEKPQRKEDVDEGKTVFVRNLPFSASDEDFRECMEQFGPVFYALVCKDKLTEHSKGSGFVKFKNKEDAEKCLSAGTELTLRGSILDPHPALKRTDVQKINEKNKQKKDNRNLFLVKEGMIIAGTPAAQGVSVTDMQRRLQLEQWKTNKLRNLNMFVSLNRLIIHNLPETLSDKQLRKLFQRYAGPKAVIQEARVMRDLRRVDATGKGLSKGYGFVSFEKHEDALKALRCINNNPTIFTPTARPIVAFSIENRAVLNTKTKRMIRSRQKNPLCKDYKPEEEEKVPSKKAKLDKITSNEEQQEEPEYAGMVAKPGTTVKLRQKYKLKDQAEKHMQNVKQQKLEMKLSRKMRRKEHFKIKQNEKTTKKKKKKDVDDSAFSKLVDKYKTKILSEKKKWYDQ